MDEADKEYKKMTERINESREAMKVELFYFIFLSGGVCVSVCNMYKSYLGFFLLLCFFIFFSFFSPAWLYGYSQASYMDFMTEAQASASRGMFSNFTLEIKGLNSPTPQN